MNISGVALAASLLTASGGFAWAQSAQTAQEFATMAANSDMFEIQSSELALQKAQSAEVKEFAQKMINDHTIASRDLMAAAEKDGVSVPAEMSTMHEAKVGALGDISGATFDAKYIEEQVAAHNQTLALMTGYAAGGEGALKAHAAKTAPIIQMHLEHIQALDDM